jgi:hypothetical protein
MLTDDARLVIERQSDEYTWSDLVRLDEEMDGMAIVALILHHLCPHHEVDMYAEIGNVKKLILAEVHLFCNAINSKKLAIDMKDPTQHTQMILLFDISSKHLSMIHFPRISNLSSHLLEDVGKLTKRI